MDDTTTILLGAAGGLVFNMMNLYKELNMPKANRSEKNFLFWLFFLFWPAAGAFLTWLYLLDGCVLKGWPAFLTGLTAPTTLQTLISKRNNDVISGSVE